MLVLRVGVFLAILMGSVLAMSGIASAAQQDPAVALANSRAVIGRKVPDLSFIKIDGKVAPLTAYRGKPLIISMAYTACTDACPAIINNLYRAVKVAQEALGPDSFHVVTIGFDTANDTPARMKSFAKSRGISLPAWDFLAADADSLDSLATATGFTITAYAGGFDHMAQVTILDGDGKIASQIYGGSFDPPVIVEPLKDLVFGTYRPVTSLSGVIDRVKLFCTVYNPNTGRYYFNYSMFIGIAIGLLCLLAILSWIVKEYRRNITTKDA